MTLSWLEYTMAVILPGIALLIFGGILYYRLTEPERRKKKTQH